MKLPIALLTLLLAGCAYMPLRPGHASITTADGFHSNIKQSQNPQAPTTQKYEKITQTPTGVITSEKNEVSIGPSQKDTTREMAAKLGSLKGVVWVGVLVFLFGAASLFYPPLKLIVGSVTTSVAACAAGVALIILPSLIVGHELLILAVSCGGVGIWWFAHRHGGLRATVDFLKQKA